MLWSRGCGEAGTLEQTISPASWSSLPVMTSRKLGISLHPSKLSHGPNICYVFLVFCWKSDLFCWTIVVSWFIGIPCGICDSRGSMKIALDPMWWKFGRNCRNIASWPIWGNDQSVRRTLYLVKTSKISFFRLVMFRFEFYICEFNQEIVRERQGILKHCFHVV